jgi:hypothetical protein
MNLLEMFINGKNEGDVFADEPEQVSWTVKKVKHK